MDLYQLEYFVEVARHRSFTRAAERIGIVQPALSLQVKRLEEELGQSLFIRNRRHLLITPAGELFLEHAHNLLAMAAAAKESVGGLAELKHGRVTIAAIPAVSAHWLPSRINAFHKRHPGIDLALIEESSDGVAGLVGDGRAEIGFLQLPETDPRLEVREVFSEPYVVAFPSRHPAAKQKSVSLEKLADEPFVRYRGKARDAVLQACRRAGFEPRIVCAARELATVHALVKAGLGVAVLPALAVPDKLPGVKTVPLRSPALKRTIAAVFRKKPALSPAGRAFLDLVPRRTGTG